MDEWQTAILALELIYRGHNKPPYYSASFKCFNLYALLQFLYEGPLKPRDVVYDGLDTVLYSGNSMRDIDTARAPVSRIKTGFFWFGIFGRDSTPPTIMRMCIYTDQLPSPLNRLASWNIGVFRTMPGRIGKKYFVDVQFRFC